MKKPAALNVNIIYNRSNTFGLATDARVLEELLRLQTGAAIGQIHHVDPREPPRSADVNFHLEVPIYGMCAWAASNIFLMNPEHCDGAVGEAYSKYMHAFDAVLCRVGGGPAEFGGLPVRVVSWCLPAARQAELAEAAAKRQERQKEFGFLALLGGSSSKADAAAAIIPKWPTNGPKLRLYTSREDVKRQLEAVVPAESPVEVVCKEMSAEEALRLQKLYSGHLLVSKAEGFGYAAAEAAASGAFMIMSDIPAYTCYRGREGVVFLPEGDGCAEVLAAAVRDFAIWTPREAHADCGTCEDARQAALKEKEAAAAAHRQAAADDLAGILADCQVRRQEQRGPVHLPPILQASSADCPPITVVTLTYNRRNFIDLACLNILLSDYPRDKIEWLVVEDSDDQDKASSDKIIGFASKNPDIMVSYMPLEKKTSIGEKRNRAVEKAAHDIILFMDDDDVYPETSFRRRVAWLLKGSPWRSAKPACVVSTMLAMYDLRTAQSAVNVPPLGLPLGQRVSEATLTFRKSFWVSKPFPDVNIAEGDDWLTGRESEVLEIPPQQIIVALSHGANVSARSIPSDARVGCFWGWDEHMIRFLHGRIGIAVEAEGGRSGVGK